MRSAADIGTIPRLAGRSDVARSRLEFARDALGDCQLCAHGCHIDGFTKTGSTNELLFLADGRILVHNLTPAFTAVLSKLNPADEQIHPALIAANGNEPHAPAIEK